MTSGTDRLACVDLVRTIAIITTISMHLLGSGGSTPAQNWAYPFVLHGGYGVIIFFVVSGFVIAHATAKRDGSLCNIDVKQFFRNRASRILPLLAFIVLLGVVMKQFAPLGIAAPFHACFFNTQPAAKYDPLMFVSIATFWFNWLLASRPVHLGLHWDIMWTLSVEEQFYLLFPFVLRKAGTVNVFQRVLLLIAVGAPLLRLAAYLSPPRRVGAALVSSFGSFDQIAIGCLLFLCWKNFSGRLNSKGRWTCVTLGTTVATAVYYFTSPFSACDRVWAPSALALGVAVFLFGALDLKIFEKLPRLLLLPGKLSYGGYLYQAVALYFCWDWIYQTPYWMALPIYVTTIFSIAAASYRFLEEPISRALRKPRTRIDGLVLYPEGQLGMVGELPEPHSAEPPTFANEAKEFVIAGR